MKMTVSIGDLLIDTLAYQFIGSWKYRTSLLSRLSRIKLAQIKLASVTTGSFISAFFGRGDVGTAIGLVVSATLLVLNAYTKDYDLGKLAQKQRQSGANLWLSAPRNGLA